MSISAAVKPGLGATDAPSAETHDFRRIGRMGCKLFRNRGSEQNMNRNAILPIMVTLCLVSSLLAGCGGSTETESAGMGSSPTAEEAKRGTVGRVEAATVALTSDQHVFRFDGVSSRTFTKCEDTVCGVSATAAGVEDALQLALGDPRSDFGRSHFAARLRDSLELKPQTGLVNGVPLVEGFGLRTGDRAFSAKFYGGWLDDGAFFVKRDHLDSERWATSAHRDRYRL